MNDIDRTRPTSSRPASPRRTASAKTGTETETAAQAAPDDGIYRVLETDEGPRMQPSALAGGPWNPEHQHGGAVSGLLTRALDQIESPVPMRLVRITVEMFRGVPLRPLRIETRTTRAGRRIQSVEADLFDGDLQVARATGLRIRMDDDLAELAAGSEHVPPIGTPPERVVPHRPDFALDVMPGFIRAVDIRIDRPKETGLPSQVWARLRCRFVEGEPTSPIVQLATLVDFTSGTGNILDYTRHTSINPDLSIHVLREPRSDWVGMRGITLRAADGVGLSSAELFDLEGPIGRAQASLLLDRR
jgi:hypothetical protein